MRKDGKSQYKIKKEKLLKIKELILELDFKVGLPWENEMREDGFRITLGKIWAIVKDEKDND